MPPKNKNQNNTQNTAQKILYFSVILLAIVLSFLIGVSLNPCVSENIGGKQIISQRTVFKEVPVYISNNKKISIRTMDIPAVSPEGEGISGSVTVILKNGTGQILADVSNILIKEDTEHSARTAAFYAFDYTKKDPKKYDVIYHIEINAPAIEGGSAGAAMAILTVAALENLELNKNISITGTINHDGTIGPAEGIEEKARAMKEINKTLFLVPPTESEKIIQEKEEYCKNYGNNEFCSTETTLSKTNISDLANIDVKEVETIKDALKYFIIS